MVSSKLCDISEIRPHLYLSGFRCITEKVQHYHGKASSVSKNTQSKLTELGITNAVDVTNIPNNPRYSGIEYLNARVDDDIISNIGRYFEKVAEFVEQARKKVLINDFQVCITVVSNSKNSWE
uniref:Uncharacterized protein n=1 Tax=Parascaris equorum TaxID=6256 RepID=A0A914R4H1_PAREQ